VSPKREEAPVLRGDAVVLAPVRDGDSARLLAWINERDDVLYSAAYHPVHQRSHEEWFDSIRQRPDVAIFGIRRRDDDELVGTCQLRGIDPVHRSAELLIRIGERGQRNRGYGEQAVRLLLAFGFRDLNLHRIQLQVFASNEAALRLYEKTGFVQEGRLRQAVHIDGRYVDVIAMGILREEFDAP
jgi:RimJ/RimL family protein N-acetyltransferase